MSENNQEQTRNLELYLQRGLSALDWQVLSLFNQLNAVDQQHVLRVLRALRETSS